MSCVGVCYGVCFLLLGCHIAAVFIYGSSTVGICNTTTLLSLPLVSIYASRCWSVAHTRNALRTIDEADRMPSSVTSGFLHSVSTVSYTCIPQLAPSIKFINFGTRLELCFSLSHRHVKYQILSQFINFLAIQLHLDSRLLHHLMTSL